MYAGNLWRFTGDAGGRKLGRSFAGVWRGAIAYSGENWDGIWAAWPSGLAECDELIPYWVLDGGRQLSVEQDARMILLTAVSVLW